MALKDLFKPKWKHSDPLVRAEALEDAGDDQRIISRYAMNDKDAMVRSLAVAKLDDFDLLDSIAKNDDDESVREKALQTIVQLAEKKLKDKGTVEENLFLLEKINDENILTDLAFSIDNPAVKIAVANKVSSDSLLIKLASNNCGIPAGEVILSKINESSSLTKLSEKASNKKIRKKASEKLSKLFPESIVDKKSDLKIAESICTSLEKSMKIFIPEDAETNLIKADEDWAVIDSNAQEKFFKRFNELKTKIIEKKNTIIHKRVISELENICGNAEALSKIFENEIFSEKKENENVKRIDQLKREFESHLFSPELSPEEKQKLTDRFCTARSQFRDSVKKAKLEAEVERENLQKNKTALMGLCEQAENAVNDFTGPELSSARKKILSSFEEITGKKILDNELSKRFKTAIGKIDEKLAHDLEADKRKKEAFVEKLNELLVKVRKTQDTEGDDLFHIVSDVRATVKEFNGIVSEINDEDMTCGIAKSFKEDADKFFKKFEQHKENKDWERWANLNKKTELCELVEKIAGGIDSNEISSDAVRLIREIQKEWKLTGPVARDKSDEIYERFKKSCDRVYEYFLIIKKELINLVKSASEIENFNEATSKIKEIQKKWNEIGAIPLAIEKNERAEFKQLCDDFFEKRRHFFQERDLERQENLKIKSGLCVEAEENIDSEDWKKTSGLYKELQKKWKSTGPVPREHDSSIWERFSTACDKFYARYNEYKIKNLAVKQDLCRTIEDIVNEMDDDSDLDELCNKAKELQRIWKETGPVPQIDSDEIWKRFRASCDIVFEKRDLKYELTMEKQPDLIEKKENLVKRAEELKDSDEFQTVTEEFRKMQEEWKAMPSVKKNIEYELRQRLNKACDEFFDRRRMFFGKRDEERDLNLKIKSDLCLQLELMAKSVLELPDFQVDSSLNPAEQIKQAMEIRDSVLVPGNLKETWQNVMKKVKEIQSKWKDTGRVSASGGKELQRRFSELVDLFYKGNNERKI